MSSEPIVLAENIHTPGIQVSFERHLIDALHGLGKITGYSITTTLERSYPGQPLISKVIARKL